VGRRTAIPAFKGHRVRDSPRPGGAERMYHRSSYHSVGAGTEYCSFILYLLCSHRFCYGLAVLAVRNLNQHSDMLSR
jgi:hypothetical protein